jgi:hypothetical protein
MPRRSSLLRQIAADHVNGVNAAGPICGAGFFLIALLHRIDKGIDPVNQKKFFRMNLRHNHQVTSDAW